MRNKYAGKFLISAYNRLLQSILTTDFRKRVMDQLS